MTFFRGCLLTLKAMIVLNQQIFVALFKPKDRNISANLIYCLNEEICSNVFLSNMFSLVFGLQQRNRGRSIIYWHDGGGELISMFVCVCLCVFGWVDLDRQRTFKVKTLIAAAMQSERWTFSVWTAKNTAVLLRKFWFWFVFLQKGMKVWWDVRGWTSFPQRRLLLLWSSNSGCVSRLSGINIVSVPQNQPRWIMSRALCEIPSG